MTKINSSEIMGYRISYSQVVCLSCYEQKFWHRTADWKDPTPIPASSDANHPDTCCKCKTRLATKHSGH